MNLKTLTQIFLSILTISVTILFFFKYFYNVQEPAELIDVKKDVGRQLSKETTVAAKFDIPLVVYGENPQFEYGGPESSRKPQQVNKRWRQEFGGLRGLREEDMVDEEISYRDVQILKFPEEEETKEVKEEEKPKEKEDKKESKGKATKEEGEKK